MRPSFLIGGDVNEIGTNAVWDRGEWLVVEADESDGSLPRPGAGSGRGHQRRGRPPRSLRVLRGPPVGVRAVRVGCRGPLRGGRGRAHRRPRSAGRSAPTWWGCPRARPTGCPTSSWAGARSPSPSADPTGSALGRLTRARPRTPQRPERRGGRRGLVGRRRHLRRCRSGRWPASPEWPAASSSGARPRGHLRRRLRPPAQRGPRRPGRRPQRGLATGWWPSSSPTATAARRAGARVRPGVRRRRRGRGHRRLRGRRGARCPGCPAAWWPTPSDASLPDRTVVLRGRPGPSSAEPWPGLLEPGDLCLHPRGRRPHLPARRADVRSGLVRPAMPGTRADDLAASRAPWGIGPRRGRPLGALTTYRVGGHGRPARSSRPTSRRWSTWPTTSTGSTCRCWCSDGVPISWWPTAASPGWWSASAPGSTGSVSTAGRCGPEGPSALPVLARRTAAAGLTGLEWAVGVPGSVGGAIRMNAGGHGSDTAATLAACRLVDLATGSVHDSSGRPAWASATGTSLAATDEVVVSGTYELEPGPTPSRSGRYRRDRALAAGQPAGRAATPDRCSPIHPTTRPGG